MSYKNTHKPEHNCTFSPDLEYKLQREQLNPKKEKNEAGKQKKIGQNLSLALVAWMGIAQGWIEV